MIIKSFEKFSLKNPFNRSEKELKSKLNKYNNIEGSFFLVILNNNEEEIFDYLKDAIEYLHDNANQGIKQLPEPWPYHDKPDLLYYRDIYNELGIKGGYISSKGKYYEGDKFIGTIYKKYWDDIRPYLP